MKSVLGKVDRNSSEPIWRQLVDHVRSLVDRGVLSDGDRLPPSRTLAKELAVNRSTVCRAYDELWALGYLESRQGSYSTVRARTRALAVERGQETAAIRWDRACAPNVARAIAHLEAISAPPAAPGWVDFASLAADPALCPAEEFKRALKQVLHENGESLLDYGDPAGYRPLREELARRLQAHGVMISAEEVMVAGGAQQALDLILRLLGRPGAGIVLEAPTYGHIVPLQRIHGLTPIEVPMADDGLDLDALEQRLDSSERPALLYTIPSFHNPTGATTSQAHRERLLSMCEAHRIPILEDGFEEEMKYFGRAILPIKSMDSRGTVLYVGTLSKVVFPGLRIGWIAADRECIRRLTVLNRCGSLSGNQLAQAAVARFLHSRAYDAYLRKLHATFRRRMGALLEGLEAHLDPARVKWTRPTGGSSLWVQVRDGRREQEPELVRLAAAHRVAITPGSSFFATPPKGLFFRLSIAKACVHDTEEGCRRLARALARLEIPAGPGRRRSA